jgi:transcriptional regulator with XRE-family HTH domain
VKNIDWARLVGAIMDRMIISQAELAKRCKVAQQTVSTWKKGTRTPNVYARRQLMTLSNEAGLNLIFFSRNSDGTAVAAAGPQGSSAQALEFVKFIEQLPPHMADEIIDYATFKLELYRRSLVTPSRDYFA